MMPLGRFASTVLLLASVAGALPTFAAAAEYRSFQTARWGAQLPSDWKLRREPGLGEPWVLHSPNHNYELRISLVRELAGAAMDFAALARDSHRRFSDRVGELEVVKEHLGPLDGRDVAYWVVQHTKLRRTTLHPHLTFRLLTRSRSAASLVTVTLSATHEKLDAFMSVLERFMDTFELRALPAATPKR